MAHRQLRCLVLTLAAPFLLLLPQGTLASGGAVKRFLRVTESEGGFTGALNYGDAFGASLAQIADLDGDGVPEMAVGATKDDNGNANPDYDIGAVWILFMNADGTVKASPPPQKLLSPVNQQGRTFGSALAWLGDLDGVPQVPPQLALAIGVRGENPDGGFVDGAVQIAFLSYDSGTGAVAASYTTITPPFGSDTQAFFGHFGGNDR